MNRNKISVLIAVAACSFFIFSSFLTWNNASFRNLPGNKKLPKPLSEFLNTMKYIPAGKVYTDKPENFIATGKDSALIEQFTLQKEVGAFLMCDHEVTNGEWLAFYNDKVKELGKGKASSFLPDTLVWQRKDAGMNEPFVEYYFRHPSFTNYPVTGVTLYQAKAFCQWKTEKLKELMKQFPDIPAPGEFKVPDEHEWTLAALGPVKEGAFKRFPWNGDKPWGENFKYSCNSGKIIDQNGLMIKSYEDDGEMLTSVIKTYPPNGYGLYDMAGNVAEWTNGNAYEYTSQVDPDIKPHTEPETGDSPRIVKGGSWNDTPIYLICTMREKRMPAYTDARIGFRVAMTLAPGAEEYFKE